MDIDGARAVTVRGGDGTAGSGFLVAHRLVLTASRLCRTGVPAPVVFAQEGSAVPYACEMIWAGGDDGAALLWVNDQAWPLAVPRTARWGRATGHGGGLACRVLLPGSVVEVRLSPFRAAGGKVLRAVLEDVDEVEATGGVVLLDDLVVGVVVGTGPDHVLQVVAAGDLIEDESFGRCVQRASRLRPVGESVELAAVLQPWGALLPPRTPGDLLHPEHEVVGFQGRGEQLDELVAWCDTPAPAAARLVVGGRGEGKTRFGRELVARMRGRGWLGGFVADMDVGAWAEALASVAHPVVLVVDDAEVRDGLGELVDLVMTRPPGSPVRLLLLAGSQGLWWERLVDHSPETAAAFEEPILELPAPDDDLAARAVVDLGTALDRLPSLPESVLPALLAGKAEAETVLQYERARWDQGAEVCGVAADLVSAAVAITHLCAPTSTRAEAVLSCLPGLAEAENLPARQRLVHWLDEVSTQPGPGWGRAAWGRILPNHLADHLVARLLAEDVLDGTVLSELARVLRPGEAPRAFAILREAAADHLDRIAGMITARPALFGPIAGDAALGEVANAPELDFAVVSELARSVPLSPGRGGELAAALHGRVVSELRNSGEQEDPAAEGGLADALVGRARSLAAIGQLGRAIECATEAAALYRRRAEEGPVPSLLLRVAVLLDLAHWQNGADATAAAREAAGILRAESAANPQVHLPKLAEALLRLAACEGPERSQDAVTAAKDAVEIYQGLCTRDAGTFLPDLVAAQEALMRHLDRAMLPDRALAAAEEVVRGLEALERTRPVAFRARYAAELDALAERHARLGRFGKALAASQSALDVHRQLAADHPATRLTHLVDALQRLSDRLADAGLFDQAQRAAAEAVDWCRVATGLDDLLRQARLAHALDSLAVCLDGFGRRALARPAAEEAVAIYRELAESDPAYRAGLAAALTNLGTSLGVGEETLAVSEEAARLFHELASRDPAYRADLGVALVNLAVGLGEYGSHSRAMPTAEAAITHLTGLTDPLPLSAAYLVLARQCLALELRGKALTAATESVRLLDPNPTPSPALAATLSCHAECLATNGHLEEARMEAARAVKLLRRLVESRTPGQHRAALADTLITLADCEARQGMAERAVAMVEEAVSIRREQAWEDPGAHQGPLAVTLVRLALHHEDAGHMEQADAVAADATAHANGLNGPRAADDRRKVAEGLGEYALGLARDGYDQALQYAENAVQLLSGPQAGSPLDRAEARMNLIECLYDLRRRPEIRRHGIELVAHCADAAEDEAVPDRLALARRLGALSLRLHEVRAHDACSKVATLAIKAYNDLTDRERERDSAYLDLAETLRVAAVALAKRNHTRESVIRSEEMVSAYEALIQLQGEHHRPRLVAALEEVANAQVMGPSKLRLRRQARALQTGALQAGATNGAAAAPTETATETSTGTATGTGSAPRSPAGPRT
ncbi:tetratricopeptide repeat protein [Actinomadura barringtoniae]|uniref:Tetratricopeptide repeat protein n=1 Tax=Actinomadura barringtoniae TaxID=1427535 RepID=A0A939TAJ0_9ACTN|nr:tetratricopeptide repeat protein [Actinomadura barringtoniae]MBO2449125.1 tetratricopeptide repeat protein [Actinomadura barringtoniae]